MMIEPLMRPVARKLTSQDAPLERLLTWWRTAKVRRHVAGKRVLDFGCGTDFKSLRSFGTGVTFRCGVDACFAGDEPFSTAEGIEGFGSLAELADQVAAGNIAPVEIIIALACFEHLEADEHHETLRIMDKLSTPDATICGTVPTPAAKPVLEFLSERMGLIDPSQIRDHKIYYDRESLTRALKETGWFLAEYRTFQLGMNSFFVLRKP